MHKRYYLLLYIVGGILLVFITGFLMFAFHQKDVYAKKYNIAIEYMQNDDYKAAITILSEMTDYMDSAELLTEAEKGLIYNEAELLLNNREYEGAIEKYSQIGDFRDSYDKNQYAKYQLALQLYKEARYDEAKEYFQTLGVYEESKLYLTKCELYLLDQAQKDLYEDALKKYEADKYDEALETFVSLGDYEESMCYQNKCREFLEIYDKALNYYENGEYYKALFSFRELGNYSDSKERALQCEIAIRPYRLATTISAGLHYSVALKENGEIVCTYTYLPYDFSDWNDIISVDGFGTMIIGLQKDGTVLVQGRKDVDDHNPEEWQDVRVAPKVNGLQGAIQVVAGQQHVAALKADGTVVADGLSDLGQTNTGEWKDIISIAAGWMHTVGLDSTGHVWFTGRDKNGQKDEITDWTDIIAISAGGGADGFPGNGHTVGLKSDGTVVAAGERKYGQCDVTGEGWTDIVAISAGDWHTVGLRKDGTVISTRPSEDLAEREHIYTAACDVSDWTDIVAISAGCGITLGLKSDGSIVSAGYGDHNQRPEKDDPEWSGIRLYKEWGTIVDEDEK